ncbi:MAG: DUF3467 domain-containing protein [Dehalococcoidia bacterium]
MTQPIRRQRRQAHQGQARPEAGGKAIPIRWEGMQEAPLIFANSLVVQHTEHEFIITFAQMQPPVALQPGDLERVEYIPARVTVRIALPPTRLKDLMDMLLRNYQKYTERMESLLGEQLEVGEND